jgi:hypothetical protein
VYSSYFHLPLQALLSKPPDYLIKWLLVIRSARECYGTTVPPDEFSEDGPLRRWIGLSVLD